MNDDEYRYNKLKLPWEIMPGKKHTKFRKIQQ